MNGDKLRAIQAPLKERYRADEKAGLVTLKANGALDSAAIACKVETGRALAIAGLHPATGGSGAELCSGDMLLEALVACAGVTVKAVATSMGIELRSGKVAAEGDLDFRGTLGVDKQAPVGFSDIRLEFRTRHRCAAGPARHVAEAHRALLRRAADAQAFAFDGGETRPRAVAAPRTCASGPRGAPRLSKRERDRGKPRTPCCFTLSTLSPSLSRR